MINVIISILKQALIYVPLVIGAYISISLMKIPDLSLESAFIMGAIISAKVGSIICSVQTVPKFFLVVLASIIGGAIVGISSSTINQFLKIPYLLSALITIGMFHSVGIFLLGGSYMSLSIFENTLENILPVTNSPEFLSTAIIILIIILTIRYILKTQLGRALAVYGSNPSFFGHYKISTKYIFICGSIISSSLAGLSGFLFSQTSGFVEITMGTDIIILCILSLVLGKLLQKKTTFISVIIPVFGIFMHSTLIQVLILSGFNLKYLGFAQSIVVLTYLAYAFKKNINEKLPGIDNLGV